MAFLMTDDELKNVLFLHGQWLNSEPDGKRADLHGADLHGANLRGANLYGANLRGAENIPFIPLACPEKGSFTAFKKVEHYTDYSFENLICELFIPKSAKRSSSTTRKCRADKAKVVAFYTLEGKKIEVEKAVSSHNNNFIYKVGETVTPEEPFDEDRWNECASGIHFFMSFQEAVNY